MNYMCECIWSSLDFNNHCQFLFGRIAFSVPDSYAPCMHTYIADQHGTTLCDSDKIILLCKLNGTNLLYIKCDMEC